MTKLTTRQADALYNGSPMSFKNAWDESKELVEAILQGNKADIVEEFHDAKYTIICAVAHKTGWNLPIPFPKKNVEKMEQRFNVWREIFKQEGLTFAPKYLINGANHQKETKVRMAIELAKKDQL